MKSGNQELWKKGKRSKACLENEKDKDKDIENEKEADE